MKGKNIKTVTIMLILFTQVGCASDSYYYNNSKKIHLELKPSHIRSNQTTDYYQNERGIVLGVTNKLILKLKNSKNLENYLQEYNLIMEKSLGENLYLLKVSNKHLTIETSNRLTEKEDVEYAHPDFIKRKRKK